MKNFQKLLPVAAVLISLSPIAANAAVHGATAHLTLSHSGETVSGMVAVNSKGRPAEFAPAAQQADYTRYSFSPAPTPNADDAPIQTGG